MFVKQHLAASKTDVTEYYTGLTDNGHEGIWIYDTDWNPPPEDGLM